MMASSHRIDLLNYGILARGVYQNLPPARLYEDGVKFDDCVMTVTGAIAAKSGAKTGRSPKDKRIVDTPTCHDDVWWGPVNMPISTTSFRLLRRRATDYLNQCSQLYVTDGFAGWDPRHRIKVRVISSRPYHALFMHNMLIRPNDEELKDFGEPDYVIFNAGGFPADPEIPGVTSETSVCLNFDSGEFVILGTQYAGEMKKGIFTIMHYLMPQRGVLSMHCSANEGQRGDVTLFFGLSGTGKTTLSADPSRPLIGDDEHCWTDDGVFNIEGGCYAKCLSLSPEKEPEIHGAIQYGTVLENTVQDPITREVDFHDDKLTENTRASYPIEYMANAKVPCIGGHPQNIILLTCDAFGVLPPVSKLTPEQAMYHFISGYTAKVAGTEMGVKEPEATFSACYGAAFLVWHPTKYAELLAEKMAQHNTTAWLINTGWTGGGYGVGSRMKLSQTRAIIQAIHAGELAQVETVRDEVFGLAMPKSCPGVPEQVLQPRHAWADPVAYDAAAQKLAKLFFDNFRHYAAAASEAILSAGPKISAGVGAK
jgi:phosphoenolpyruvate carboxykinase (ATP)